MSTQNTLPRLFPFSAAQSTGTDSPALLAALLSAWSLDEVSNAEDFGSVQWHLQTRGRPDKDGRTTVGMAFWVYPTGLHGPYHEAEDGTIVKHGLLLTIERGTRVEEVIQRVKAGFVTDGIEHMHIAAA